MTPENRELEQYQHQFFQWRFVEGRNFGEVLALLKELQEEQGKVPAEYALGLCL